MKCPRCGSINRIVNECMCDPNNMPTFADPSMAYVKINRMCSELSQMSSIHHDLYRQGDLCRMHVKQMVMQAERILSLAKSCECLTRASDEGSYADLAASGGIVEAP